MRDTEIVQLFFDRDERGITEMSGQYGGRLLRAAERLLPKEDAEEILNDTYLAMWKHIPPDRPKNLEAYAQKILKNLSLNRLRDANALKRRAVLVELDDALSAVIPDPRANTEEQAILEVSDLLNSFLKKQSPSKRNLFVMRYLYGQQIPEITEALGFSEAKVRKTLLRMKDDLKKFLQEN